MTNSSVSSSMRSFDDSSVKFTEEREMAAYASIKMNLQAIEKTTHDINLKFKNLQQEMQVTAALITAIEERTTTTQD